MNLASFYDTNSEFKEYVDRYCKQYNESRSIDVREALDHKLVKEVALHYGFSYSPCSLCSH